MKKLLYLFFSITLLLTGCSNPAKEVKILNLKLQGDLKGCYVVLDSVCQATLTDEDKYTIKVNLKRTEESVPYTDTTIGVLSSPDEKKLTLGGFGYETYTQEKELIKSFDAEESHISPSEQLAILKLAPGEQGYLTLTFEKEEIPEGIIITSDLKFISTGEISLEGSIGKYGIKNFSIDFNFVDKKIIGQYQYLSSPPGAFLYLLGNVVSSENSPGEYSSNIYIAEDNGNGELTGKLKGQLKLVRDSKTSPYYYVLLGTFRNFRYQDFRYKLQSSPLTEIEYGNVLENGYASTMNPSFINEDFASMGFKSFKEEANYSSSTTGDMSIDDFLRQYRSFCKKYLLILKKYKSNDPSVALEYLELTNQYAELLKKSENLKGKMSSSQISELTKINAELSKALSTL